MAGKKFPLPLRSWNAYWKLETDGVLLKGVQDLL